MALRPGDKFNYADLSVLLAPANAIGGSHFDLSGVYNVSPMYTDPNGKNYGYRQCGSFALGNQGAGYNVGDTLASPNVTYRVAKVDGGGSILGLVVEGNAGFAPGGSGAGWETANDPASPQNLTGGTGAGATVSFVVSHIGPTQGYAMPDYATTFALGYMTALKLNGAGAGYHAGDIVTVTELTFVAGTVTVTVNTVDGTGKILTYTVNNAGIIPTALIPIPQDVNAMTVTGGHGAGATFTGLFIIPQKPQWLTELDRLRANLYAIPDFIHGDDPRQCVSGAWPVGGPTANFLDTWFWFAGNSASVNLTSLFVACPAKFTTAPRNMKWSIPGIGEGINSNGLTAKTVTVSFIVGGNQNMPASGTVFILLRAFTGSVATTLPHGGGTTTVPDATDPATLVSVGSTNFPAGISIATVSGVLSPPTKAVCVSCQLPASLAPGRYDLTLNIADGGQDSDITDGTTFINVQTRHTFIDILNSANNNGLLIDSWILDAGVYLDGAATFNISGTTLTFSGKASINIAYTNAIPAPGIHNSLPIKKIQVPGDDLGNAPGFSAVEQIQVVATDVNFNPGSTYNPGDTAIDPNGNTETCTVGPFTAQMIGLYGDYWGGSPYGAFYQIYPNPAPPYGPSGWASNLGAITQAGATFQLTALGQVYAPEWRLYPYPQPNFRERIIYGGITITTSVPGMWTAKCPPISDLNIVPASAMPWNLQRTKWARNPGSGLVSTIQVNPMLKGDLANTPTTGPSAYIPQVSNSYDQTLTCEEQAEPPSWVASRVFTPNFVILDPNGNLQVVFAYGQSGLAAPGFSSAKAGVTWDGGAPGAGTLGWSCSKVLKPASSWAANKATATGATVTDANGNVQTAQNSGTTGAAAPVWSEAYNGLTNDNGVSWKLTGPAKPITPQQHRIPDLPRYPNYWFSETIPRLLPPVSQSNLTVWGAYNQWKSVNSNGSGGVDAGWNDAAVPANPNGLGQAYGWWIYSISLNRTQPPAKTSGQPADATYGMGDTYPGMGDEGNPSGTGMGGPGSGSNAGPILDNSPIPVTIGCIRNGVFVAFGTYNTGSTYQVLWPVFTSDCLVYQCTERIDLQPLAIAQNNSVSTGAAITKPMCAAFFTDTLALLELIN